jgi:hypothetical protein
MTHVILKCHTDIMYVIVSIQNMHIFCPISSYVHHLCSYQISLVYLKNSSLVTVTKTKVKIFFTAVNLVILHFMQLLSTTLHIFKRSIMLQHFRTLSGTSIIPALSLHICHIVITVCRKLKNVALPSSSIPSLVKISQLIQKVQCQDTAIQKETA